MICLNCNSSFKVGFFRISQQIKCPHCSAVHLKQDHIEDEGRPILITLTYAMIMLLGPEIVKYLESVFEFSIGKPVTFITALLIVLSVNYKYQTKYGESTYVLQHQPESVFTKFDAKVVTGILVAVIIAFVVLWQIPRPGSS